MSEITDDKGNGVDNKAADVPKRVSDSDFERLSIEMDQLIQPQTSKSASQVQQAPQKAAPVSLNFTIPYIDRIPDKKTTEDEGEVKRLIQEKKMIKDEGEVKRPMPDKKTTEDEGEVKQTVAEEPVVDEKAIKELAAVFDKFHLTVVRDKGLVSARQKGRKELTVASGFLTGPVDRDRILKLDEVPDEKAESETSESEGDADEINNSLMEAHRELSADLKQRQRAYESESLSLSTDNVKKRKGENPAFGLGLSADPYDPLFDS